MLIQDFYNLMVVVSCPKCGQDPDGMALVMLSEDNFICVCDNCNSKIKVTYKTDIYKILHDLGDDDEIVPT